ncbi:MAG: peptidoglycan DD-metalloendopeptidase family protein [Deltaproteobacteria bacterium]|nr:peptidoglycan DD-metalloendopeptidase family protein [Deltaproteobacteria bacterium]
MSAHSVADATNLLEGKEDLQPLLVSEKTRTKICKVEKNDSFYSLMEESGVPTLDILGMAKKAEGLVNLGLLKEGEKLELTFKGERLKSVEYRFAELKGLLIERTLPERAMPERAMLEPKEGLDADLETETEATDEFSTFTASVFDVPHKIYKKTVTATIDSSMYEAGLAAGIDPTVIMNLTDIFAWDVDFATSIWKGDSFTVVYDVIEAEGAPLRAGLVHAAKINNAGKEFNAFYYKDADGRGQYYDEDGGTLRRALLKSPLRYRRISSYFSKRRFHPIQKKYKAHHGIDYAAPTGTPIEAAGDGRVLYAGWKGGYGNYIVIRHNSTYTTAYGHLSKIKKGLKKGSRVKQGSFIGRVGSTGLSTGPHLHYEVRVRGQVVNPLKIKSTPKKKLPKTEIASFNALRDGLAIKLSQTSVASETESLPLKSSLNISTTTLTSTAVASATAGKKTIRLD